ncbi:MAG: anthranilate phosphoribosyltransferase [Bacillati bacterium ANGP1]|uniref:Anthranilate phosphoribosyltransferase n=1 Tax=Candidatus Segetimicrobium genomatis TaxID=2569760 RepID=A0A537KET0_9BACT|nr:MAG: anthranilate phosphoribosyltransferase [Terrabacteria group bacterium ANGP1]
MALRPAISKVAAHQTLTEAEAHEAMGRIMDGEATAAQIASFITALAMRGETVEEITGFARAIREHAVTIAPQADHLVDIVGTGGDRLNTFNISTTSAFVIAGAGGHVAKHGNRAASSKCGSADVLEALGVNLGAPPEVVQACVEEVGFGFMFAPHFHPAFKHALAPRREIGIRTVFNILGPLTNPARARRYLQGAPSAAYTELMARVLSALGADRAFVVHGQDGMDEISLCAPTQVSEVADGAVRTYTIAPEEFGFRRAALEDLRGGTPQENAEICVSVLRGEQGPRRDVVLLNAGAALVAAGVAGTIKDGAAQAARSIDSGAAYAKLEALRLKTKFA